MDRDDIIIALSHRPDIQKDVDGLVCRIAGIGKRNPIVDRLKRVINAENKVIDFIKNSKEILLDTGYDLLLGNRLTAFKDYERLWASRKNEGTPEKNWYKMQDEFSEYIKNF